MTQERRETPAAALLTLLGDLIVLNVLCLICALPIVTAGPGISAMYAVLFRRNRRESVPVIRTFFTSFRENFLQAAILEAIVVLIAAVSLGDMVYALSLQGAARSLFLTVGTVVGFIALTLQTLALPQQAVYRNTIRGYLGNAFSLALCGPGRLLLSGAAWVLVFACPDLFFSRLGVIFLMWGISFPAWITVKLLDPLFLRTEQA